MYELTPVGVMSQLQYRPLFQGQPNYNLVVQVGYHLVFCNLDEYHAIC